MKHRLESIWLLAALGVVVAAALLGVAAYGAHDQRFAEGRKLDAELPTPVPAQAGQPEDVPPIPPEVAAAQKEWPLPNRDYSNSRATADAEIDSTNVSRLGVAWQRELHGASKWGSAASGPVIADGVVYFQDLTSNVFALDVKTGKPRWTKGYDRKAFGPNGPAIGWGKVFAQDGDRNVVALDLATGRELWRRPLAGPTGQQQPIPYGGYVLTGIAAGRRAQGTRAVGTALLKPGASGFAYGIDQASGRIAWEFQTVERGFWGNPKVNSGAGIWFPTAVDLESGLTFWSTGNPAPAPGTATYPNAVSRPGPNLYSNTMLALELGTGKLRWFNQALPHDIYHHDFQNPPMLVDAGGRKLVIGSGKMGIAYALDRATGRLVWKRPVGRHQNDTLTTIPLGKTITVYPGFWGGMETPGAYADGTVYFAVVNMPTPYNATAFGAKDGQTSVEHLEGRTQYHTGTSEVVALAAATGRVRWSTPLPEPNFGAATVVNDLVFTATYDGLIYALRRDNGRILWRFQAPGGIIAWPAVAGDTVVWPVGLGRKPVLLALRLGGTKGVPKPEARPSAVGGG